MVALDNEENVLIGFSEWGGSNLKYDDSIITNTTNVELIKLDSSGTRLWRTAVAGSNRLGEKGLAVDNQNNILITGKNSTDDVFLSKYDKNGNELWYKTAGVSGANKKDEITSLKKQRCILLTQQVCLSQSRWKMLMTNAKHLQPLR